jgi:hypothetical protein
MKKTILLLALTVGLANWAAVSFAGECDTCVRSIPKTHPRACKVKVCTEEIDRCTQVLTAKGPCGKTYSYTVTQVTYKDVYCDGTTRIWKATI